ncbi:D-TA family PLP-dependent enzyme [Roseimaritima ulvae]|uniref:D-threonine aldolase n=1 Tax=Roseimaritima ulvae TaxID=980254 RepID=A0A5B9QQG0_9BACT|nr:D-TA family PLP-dependent enzyme [Roseimaritima ulvae]QEG40152.1 D-threonine aldolase [Roseimaritima ulvae]
MTSASTSPETFCDWPAVQGFETVATPALLVDADRVAANIAGMLTTVDDDAARLRPHVKTHKMSAVVQLYRDAGIEQFKAATIAEAEMIARTGGLDCLLAHQPTGKKIAQLAELVDAFPATRFSTIVDNPDSVAALAAVFADHDQPLQLLIDVDCGMHRTGVAWGESLQAVRQRIIDLPGVRYGGLHVYDGHLHQPSLTDRTAQVDAIRQSIDQDLKTSDSSQVVVGGSPTFPIWAAQPAEPNTAARWQCSPGTMVFWDIGYASLFADMQYEIAAALLTTVISKPGADQICLDLGHKSVASEMALEKRVVFPSLPDARLVSHSEEHLVVETPQAAQLSVGDALIALPRHICPTVALHPRATIVRDGKVSGESWQVDGKNR